MTDLDKKLDEILETLASAAYVEGTWGDESTGYSLPKYNATKAINSLISKAYIQGLHDATADPGAMTSKEVFERNQRINEHSEGRE